jgi:hypothetical protein
MAGLLVNVVMLLQDDFVCFFSAFQVQIHASPAFEIFDFRLLLKRRRLFFMKSQIDYSIENIQ